MGVGVISAAPARGKRISFPNRGCGSPAGQSLIEGQRVAAPFFGAMPQYHFATSLLPRIVFVVPAPVLEPKFDWRPTVARTTGLWRDVAEGFCPGQRPGLAKPPTVSQGIEAPRGVPEWLCPCRMPVFANRLAAFQTGLGFAPTTPTSGVVAELSARVLPPTAATGRVPAPASFCRALGTSSRHAALR